MSATLGMLREPNVAQTISEIDTFTERRYAQFAQRLAGVRSLLDVGWGVGRGGLVLRRMLPDLQRVDGVEIVPERVAHIPRKHLGADLRRVAGLDQNADHYDAIVAGEVIEHTSHTTCSMRSFTLPAAFWFPADCCCSRHPTRTTC